MQQQTITNPSDLRDAWLNLQRTGRAPRQRDAALLFGVSEAQLVAAQCGAGATRLEGPWIDVVRGLESLGPVMALTRNEHIVIEKDGLYGNISAHGPMAQVVDEGIDLRLFLSRWGSAFALSQETARGVQRSLQFFDVSGTAVHKVFLREPSSLEAYHALVARFTASDQSAGLSVQPIDPEVTVPDAEVAVAALTAQWRAMQDTHEFFGLLRSHRVGRQQAFRLVGPELAREVSRDAFRTVLDRAAATRLSIMVFVGNRGCIEIHSGPIERVVAAHGWLNVLDPGFNLHAREDGVASAWVVHKPGEDGVVSSLELFSPDGENVALLFANRKAGQETVDQWKQLLRGLEA